MKFYYMEQNNSGGYIVVNQDIERYLIIEADNVDELKTKFNELDNEEGDWCQCCGKRWLLPHSTDEPKETDNIEDYMSNIYLFMRKSMCIVHKKDGTKDCYLLERINYATDGGLKVTKVNNHKITKAKCINEEIKSITTEMQTLEDNYDTEVAHRRADGLLRKALELLGYEDLVKEFDKIHKWYA